MSRSRKKCFWTISKAWYNFKERVFRRRVREELHRVEIELKVDPDADFEASLNHKKMGDWGTKIGMEFDPCNEQGSPYGMTEQEMKEEQERGRRK